MFGVTAKAATFQRTFQGRLELQEYQTPSMAECL